MAAALALTVWMLSRNGSAMAVGSIMAGIASFLFLLSGFVLTVLPAVGAVLSFLAPLSALVGLVLGGLAMSRAHQEGASTSAGLTGIIISAVAFFPALLVALTCGLCNACMTAGIMSEGGPAVPFGVSSPRRASVVSAPPRTDANAPDAGRVRPFDAGTLPPGAPPPPFPPPPMPSEPRRAR